MRFKKAPRDGHFGVIWEVLLGHYFKSSPDSVGVWWSGVQKGPQNDSKSGHFGSKQGHFWTIISKVPPIPLVFSKMGFKKGSQEGSSGVIWGHLGRLDLQPSSGWALQIAKVEGWAQNLTRRTFITRSSYELGVLGPKMTISKLTWLCTKNIKEATFLRNLFWTPHDGVLVFLIRVYV
jgi:hypothetical protein